MLTRIFCCSFLMIAASCPADSPAQIYQQRIMPLLASGSNSCAECHLQGIDLKSVLSDDPAETFADLRARGWIDTADPLKSKLLEFISRQSGHSTDLQRRVRTAEYQAVSTWIEAACRDVDLLQQPLVKNVDLEIDLKLIRHARTDQMTRRFTIAVWSQLERCANCHSPDRNAAQVSEHGDQMSWIVPRDPAKTIELLAARELIDLDDPQASLLRTKPTGIVDHGAGSKFPAGGRTDSAWSAFLIDYAKTLRGEYPSAEELPEASSMRSWRSGLHLRIVDLPASWGDQLYSVTLHRQLPDGSFESKPSAFAECYVAEDRLRWSNSLTLLDRRETIPEADLTKPIELDEALPKGIYQLRFAESGDPNTDRGGRTPASISINAPWDSGHRAARVIDFKDLHVVEPPTPVGARRSATK